MRLVMDFDMLWITKAIYCQDYKIDLYFSNGEAGIVDLRDIILQDKRPIFQELRDVERFKQFKVDMDTVVWENGLDLAPEFLYGLARNSL